MVFWTFMTSCLLTSPTLKNCLDLLFKVWRRGRGRFPEQNPQIPNYYSSNSVSTSINTLLWRQLLGVKVNQTWINPTQQTHNLLCQSNHFTYVAAAESIAHSLQGFFSQTQSLGRQDLELAAAAATTNQCPFYFLSMVFIQLHARAILCLGIARTKWNDHCLGSSKVTHYDAFNYSCFFPKQHVALCWK